jgi:hypothetical protein
MKMEDAMKTVDNQPSERVLTLIYDYAKNGEFPSFGSEQPGEMYYFSPLTIKNFGVVNTSKAKDEATVYCYDE